MEANQTPTAALDLERLEGAICEFVSREVTDSSSRWKERLESGARDAALRLLCTQLGPRYSSATLVNFECYDDRQTAVLARLKDFAQRMPDLLAGGGGLMLYGPPGTGKDHLLAAMLKVAIVGHRLDARWYDGQELFEKARYAIRREKESEFRKELSAPHILAISDPQPPKGELSDYQIGLIRDVIDRRYRRRLSTWITTNLDSADAANALLTEPVMQRLRESAGKIFCEWPSYRERRKAAW